MTTRENSAGQGTHRYHEGPFEITRMGNNEWYVFENGQDMGQSFSTLRSARAWCRKRKATEDKGSKLNPTDLATAMASIGVKGDAQ